MEKLLEKSKIGSKCRWPVGLLAAALMISASAAPNTSRTMLVKKSLNAPSANVPSSVKSETMAKARATLMNLPLTFEVNRGQTDSQAKYLGRAKHYVIFMTPDGTTLRINSQAVLRMKLQNANTSAKIQGEDLKASYSNYYIGNDPSKWLSHVSHFGQVRYENVYEGIDVVYRGDERDVEYDFVVKPGVDPSQIRMIYEGADSIAINAQGDLELKTAAGSTTHHKPVVYQVINGQRKLVDGEFLLADNKVGFKLGNYDRKQTLVIDPTLQVLSFFGGTLNDEAAGIAANATGVFFVGRSESATLPPGTPKPSNGINWDAFLTGLNAGTPGVPDSGGTALRFTTYFGSNGDDAARGVAIDNAGVTAGNIYVAGYTNGLNFPIAGAAVNYDGFIARFSSGGGLTAAILVGGPGADQLTSIALDFSTFSGLPGAANIVNPATDPTVVPNVVVGGLTTGAINRPATANGVTTSFRTCTAGGGTAAQCGTIDGYVAIFKNDLSHQASTYYGGGGNDQVNGVAVDVGGNIYATGFVTPAVAPNAPVTNGIGSGLTVPPAGNKDAALAATNAAVAFVTKYACTTGTPPIGVTSPPPAIPACGGTNNLKTLSNSAMFGGSGSFINPQQTVLGTGGAPFCSATASGTTFGSTCGISEAGYGIAVDQNGLFPAAVAGNFNDIVPATESTAPCNGGATPTLGLAPNCAVSPTNPATAGGFQPGVAGPRVYVVGNTANANFATSLLNPSCAFPPLVSSTPVPALCPVPTVSGGAFIAATNPTLPVPVAGGAPIRTTAAGANSGQTQGWLVAFQFPAPTQIVVSPAATNVSPVTTLSPPTIPNYVVLQPPTCPTATTPLCVQGGLNTTTVFATPPAHFGCTVAGGVGPVTCPAFLGSWNAVAVDTDQQAYVIGQIGMSTQAPAVFGTGLATRLALEIERIDPNGFPEALFPSPAAVNPSSTFLVDNATGGSNFGQILPGAPPYPDPNQPGGLGNGITVSQTREAFFVGTSTVLTPNLTGGVQATATATIDGSGHVLTCVISTGGSGYTSTPNITITGGGGDNLARCVAGAAGTPGTVVGGSVVTGSINATPGGSGYTSIPTVTVDPPPSPNTSLSYLIPSAIEAAVAPTPTPTQGNLGGTGSQNAGTGVTGSGPEDVIYGAIQFYDAIASPAILNFSTTVNGPIPTKQFINFSNWQGLPLNVPPGCVITATVGTGPGGITEFLVTPVFGVSQWQVIPTAASVTVPGVVSVRVTFNKNSPVLCAGGGVPLDGFDPVLLTMTVSAPLNLSPQNTFIVTTPVFSGLLQPYVANGFQLVANQTLTSHIGVTTAVAAGPINFTVQIVPGPNWVGPIANSVTVPLPTDIIYEATGTTQTNIPVTVNTNIIAGLPVGVYTAFIAFTASPETPVTPAALSVLCSSASATVATGTTTPSCIPISITVTPQALADVPATIVFGASTTPQQTNLTIANPIGTAGPYNFTAGYAPWNFYGSPLPATNVFFVGTGTTLIPANLGPPVTGTIASGGQFVLPVQVNPTGLATGVYGGMIIISNNGLVTGATPQTTVPILVYVGPKAGEDAPTGNGLGLMFPPNSPFPTGGIGGCPQSYPPPPSAQFPLPCPPPGTQGTGASTGAYPLVINVPSGYTPAQLAGPTLIQVTALNNIATTGFIINAPTVPNSLPGVSITNTNQAFGGSPSNCTSYAQFSALPLSTMGPTCSWSIWVDSTLLNSANTAPLAQCPATGVPAFGGLGVTGNLTFPVNAASFPFAPLQVPLTICVSDFPNLNVTQPVLYPNPTFGTGIPQPNFCGTPAFPVGCPQMIVGIPIPAGGITLQSTAGNSTLACAEIGINTNGGGWTPTTGVQSVTVAPFTVPWLSLQASTAPYLGPIPAFSQPGFLTGWGFDGGFGVEGGPGAIGPPIPVPLFYPSINLNSSATNPIPGANYATCFSGGPCSAIGTVAPFPAGPATVNNAMQTMQICANTDQLGNASGTFRTSVVINGAGVGPVTIPITFNIGGTGTVAGGSNLNQLGVFRNQASGLGVFVEAGPSNTFDAASKFRNFGLNGDISVLGDFAGDGIVRLAVFRCPAAGVCQWFVDMNNNGTWDGLFGGDVIWNFGLPGDTPVVGDWNGSGTAKIGVMRCPTPAGVCTWYLDIGNKHVYDAATVGTYLFGLTGDKPAIGNWAPASLSTPVDQIGIFRCPAAGVCQWVVESLGLTGISTSIPVSVFSPADQVFNFGLTGDLPVVGNWNANGRKRIGVYRGGQWFVDTNGNGAFDPAGDQIFNFGLPGDQPVVGFFTN